VELSRDYTQDLPVEDLGKPILEVVLEAGDMLYFPRGVIYQCANDNAENHSTYITISTYQQNTWGDFMQHAVEQAIAIGLEEDVGIRSGLPINYLSFLGTGKNMDQYVEDEEGKKSKKKFSNVGEAKVKAFKEKVKAQLAKLIDHIDVNTASDTMCEDFFTSRLPPFGHVKKPEDGESEGIPEDTLPGLTDKIKIKYPKHMRVVYVDEEEEDDGGDEGDDSEEEDEEMSEDDEKPSTTAAATTKSPTDKTKKKTKSPAKTDKNGTKKTKEESMEEEEEEEDDEADLVDDFEPHMKILHTLNNDRFWHMSGATYETENGCVRLHVSFAKAAVQLLNDSHKFTAVKDILMDDEDDKVKLATVLFAHGLIEVEGK